MTDKAMTAVERELATDIRMSLEAFRDGEATFDETHADLLTLARQSAVIDECDHGHSFAKLPDHPMRNGLARCPHCMAEGLTLARQSVGVEEMRGGLRDALDMVVDAARDGNYSVSEFKELVRLTGKMG